MAAKNGPPGPITATINGPPCDNWSGADHSWQPKMVPEKFKYIFIIYFYNRDFC